MRRGEGKGKFVHSHLEGCCNIGEVRYASSNDEYLACRGDSYI